MKNLQFFPFQRNSYFTGKLLTARDFSAEQQYMNDKRRLINRFFGGVGIVCGLLVTRLDAASVIIESGLALDGTGREIVIDRTVIKRLSDIDGFKKTSRVMKPYAYLCVEYAEEPREPMHGVTDHALADSSFNKTEEGYRLFLTYDEPPAMPAAMSEEGGGHSAGERILSRSLESRLAGRFSERLYLARIGLVRWGEAYEIGEVEPAPFEQYAMGAVAFRDEYHEPPRKPEPPSEPEPAPVGDTTGVGARLSSSGTLTIAIPKGAVKGQVFYSDEVSHGLGGGEVYVALGLRSKDSAVFGGPGVFADSADYEWAARADFEQGTFQAGVLLKTGRYGGSVTLSWHACREKPQGRGKPIETPRVTVSPGTSTVKPGGGISFKAEVRGLDNRDVTWRVIEPGGGLVDSYGRYTAPGLPGVYAVNARSVESPETEGTAYVVVRE